MLNEKTFFLKLNWQELVTADSPEAFLDKFQIPEKNFPPRFLVKGRDFLVGGYFVSYHPRVTISKLIELCRNNRWQDIAAFNGDFLVFYLDFQQKKILVLTDQTGKFPCYFHLTDKTIILSTSFYEIVKRLDKPTLDVERTLEFVYRDTQVTDKTIIKGVYLLFPGALGEFTANGIGKVKPLLDVEEFLGTPFKKYSSLKKFADDFLEVLNTLIKERLDALNNLNFCSEISSGFDSSLISYLLKKNYSKPFICYSEIAKKALQDTQPAIVSEFAQKHNLTVKFVPHDEFYPFSSERDLEWIRREPSYIQKSQVYRLFDLMSKNGAVARFTGEGGDEAYWSSEEALNLRLRFPAQKQYFDYQSLRRYGIDKILTEEAVEMLLDKKRFRRKKFYPLFISHSVVNLSIITFPFSWETEIWPMTPFADTRLIQVARGIPDKGIDKSSLKQKIWQGREDIFTKSQFRPKGGTEEHYSRFLTEKADFIISTLRDSLLGKAGLIRSSEIIKNVSRGQISPYLEGDTAVYLVNLLELEYFIQQNSIRVL